MKQTYLTFKYLKPANDNATKENCVTLGYSLKPETFIVRDEANREYKTFENYAAFKAWFNEDKKCRCLHEVVRGTQKQKIKFDIDCASDLLDDVPEVPAPVVKPAPVKQESNDWVKSMMNAASYNQALKEYNASMEDYREWKSRTPFQRKCMKLYNEFMNHLMRVFNRVYLINGVTITPADFAVSDSSNAEKFSHHVVIKNFHVRDNEEAREFTRLVLEELRPEVAQMIDAGVNKSTQNFRLPYCHKLAAPTRVKQIIAGEFDDMIIQNTEGTKALSSIIIKDPKKNETTNEIIIDDNVEKYVVSVAKPFTHGQFLHSIRDNKFYYNRAFPSHCKVCDRVHEKDNTGVISINKNKDIYYYCRHAEFGKGLYVNTVKQFYDEPAVEEPEYEELMPEIPEDFNVIEYEEPEVREINLNAATQIIRSPMGTGKTNQLIAALENAEGYNIIMVSFRKSFTTEMMGRFERFIDYRDVKGNIDAPRVIIQFESLHRLITNPDKQTIIILDETESIISQTSSKNNGNLRQCWAKFEQLLNYAEVCIAMDAMAGARTFNLMRRHRGDREIVLQYNKYKPAAELAPTDIHYDDYNRWRKEVLSAAGHARAEPFVCAGTSKAELDVLERTIRKDHPELNIKYYNADTSNTTREEELSDVNNTWAEVDILLYTPTISAGVSFTGARFKRMFCYFVNYSCDYLTSIQMMGRVRNIAAREYHVFIKQNASNLPASIERVEAAMSDTEYIMSMPVNPGGIIPYRLDRKNKKSFIHQDNYYKTHVENIAHMCASRNQFKRLFIGARLAMGVKLEFVRDAAGEDFDTKKAELSETRADIKKDKDAAIAEAAELRACDAEELRGVEDGLEIEEKNALRKYNLRELYGWYGEIDEAFVRTYENRRVKNIWNNLNIATADKDKNLSENIEEARRLYNDHNKNKDNDTISKLGKKNNPVKAQIAADVLNIIMPVVDGARYTESNKYFEDGKLCPRVHFNNVVDGAVGYIQSRKDAVSLNFKIPCYRVVKARVNVKSKLELINSVLRGAFDVGLVRNVVKGKRKDDTADFKLKCYYDFEYKNGEYVVCGYDAEAEDAEEAEEAVDLLGDI